MIERGIASRYAKALFDLSCADHTLEQKLVDFELTVKLFKDNPKLVKLLKSPQLSMDDKKTVLQDSLKDKLSSDFLKFLFFIIEKGRLDNLKQTAREYRLMVNKYLKIWEADIVTAVPIDEESENKLKQKLEEVFHKKIKINKKVNPQMLGGAILIMGNEMLDWSVKGRLRKLKDNLIAMRI